MPVTLRARVKNGRILLDEPTDLPEGTELELVATDVRRRVAEDQASALTALEAAYDDVHGGMGIPVQKADSRFSREAFLASPKPSDLAEDLSAALSIRLRAAEDRISEELRIVDELIDLGHPLRLCDSRPVHSFSSSSWCDDGDLARNEPRPQGHLFVRMAYSPSPSLNVQVDTTFRRDPLPKE